MMIRAKQKITPNRNGLKFRFL